MGELPECLRKGGAVRGVAKGKSMTSFYDDCAADANEALEEFGQTCVLGVVTAGAYDPETGGASTTTTNHTVTAAIFDYPTRHIDGTLILTGDKRALVSAVGLTVEPKPGHTFTDAAAVVYQVVNAKNLAPAGTSVLWTLQVRK